MGINIEPPLVSVLMTVYNREKYVGAAIESVLSQTYQNWELIITDDQSKDKSVSIIKSYADKDSRIHLHINEHNLGDYPNRNKAASFAKGKYLKYLDADDLMYPWALQCMVSMMEDNPSAKWGLCSLPPDRGRMYPYVLHPKEAYEANYRHRVPLFSRAPLSAIIDRGTFEKVGGFSGKQHLGDFELWHILGRYYPVLLMPQGMVWYRVHDDQQSNDNRIDPYVPFKYLINVLEHLNHPDCPLSSSSKQYAIKNAKKAMGKMTVDCIMCLKFDKARQMLNAANINFFTALRYLILKK